MSRFTEILKEARQRRGLSQNALAKAVGINASHLNRIERGVRNPPRRRTVLALAQALHLSPEQTNLFLESAGYASERAPESSTLHSGPPTVSSRNIQDAFAAERILEKRTPETRRSTRQIAHAFSELVDSLGLSPLERTSLLNDLGPLLREMGSTPDTSRAPRQQGPAGTLRVTTDASVLPPAYRDYVAQELAEYHHKNRQRIGSKIDAVVCQALDSRQQMVQSGQEV